MAHGERGAGRPVLITGCSSGIGRCAAAALRSRGYRVFATARKVDDVTELARQGFEALRLDLTDEASIAAVVDELLVRTGGTLYGLFNNGGYGQPGAVEDLPVAALRAQFETNVFGWHELTRRVLPVMRGARSGRIVQCSSVLGLVVLKYRGAYNASKFALEALSDTLRLELAGSGVHVSLIEPGPIASRFRENAYAAFMRAIDADTSVHRDSYRALAARLADRGPTSTFTLPPEAVVKRLVHALESRRPRAHYYVTVPTYALAGLRRVLSGRLLDRVLAAASGAESNAYGGKTRK